MIPTDKEKERIRQRQRELNQQFMAETQRQQRTVNPLYGTNPFEPSSLIPTVPSDPKLSQPLPSGRYLDHSRYPTGASAARAAEIAEFRRNKEKYVQENLAELNNEQSLVEKSMSMMARVFNYRDTADAQVFGVDLSSVESTWDGFLRYFTGAYDLLSIGFGGLLSAAPGGIDTLAYEQLSGGKSVAQVLSGEMEPGSAPSPGQIALTSIALEAKRIREGNARLSDVLLMNPATAPFILAALAADSSPLQKDGFNIMDKEQREAAFSSGYEQWMSGITDAGLMFADPLIGVGVATKVLRAGMLGRLGPAKTTQGLKAANMNAMDELETFNPGSSGRNGLETIIARGQELTVEQDLSTPLLKKIADDPDYAVPVPEDVLQSTPIRASDPIPEYKNPMSRFYHILHQVDDEGNRVMTYEQLKRDPSFDDLNIGSDVAALLLKTRNPAESALFVDVLQGVPGALSRLEAVAPGMSDTLMRFNAQRYTYLNRYEPAKLQEVKQGLSAQIQDARQRVDVLDETLRRAEGEDITDAARFTVLQNIKLQRETLQKNIDEMTELYEVAEGRKTIDLLDPTNPFYNPDRANRIVTDMFSARDAVTTALKREISEAAQISRTFFPTTANPYSRMVMRSRERRAKARYQYAVEGTSIFPHKRTVIDANGKAVRQWDGWLSKSEFEGTSRLQRAARVWRWMGTETPSGYIGLKGTATVGSEREFTAAINTQLLSGDGVIIQRVKTDADGNTLFKKENGKLVVDTEPVLVGGKQKRDEYFRRFYEALNNPDEDALQALKAIEEDLMDQFALAYNIEPGNMKNMLQYADKQRESTLELIRKQAYFVDPQNGSMQHVPYLDSQLANGTYLHNWQALEKILIDNMKKDGGESLRRAFEVPAQLAGSAYGVFNDFWRPATLLRLSYTQRNVFEGMIRAMAFSGSLAPLLWPIQATIYGIESGVAKKQITRRAKIAAQKIQKSDFNAVLQEYNRASVEEVYVRTARSLTLENDSEPMMYWTRSDGTVERMTMQQYDQALETAMEATTQAYAKVKAAEPEFTKAVEGTAFGKWREKNIKDLMQEEITILHRMAIEQDMAMEVAKLGGPIDPTQLRDIREYAGQAAVVRGQLDALRFDPVQATELYRQVAGRQKRIGSGQSIGPDGNYHNNAFEGPLAQINAGLMSSDLTIIQSLSLNAERNASPFYKRIIRNNEAIPFNNTTATAWADGLAQTIEEASSSWLGRALVRNNWDEERVFEEMIGTKEGQSFLVRISGLMGEASLEDVAKTADEVYTGMVGADSKIALKDRTNIRRFTAEPGKAPRLATGERLGGVTNADWARGFISDTASMIIRQMQSRKEFMDLLEIRAREKMGEPVVAPGAITGARVKAIVDALPEDEKKLLGYVQGADIVQMGADGFLGIWANLAGKMFNFLGRIPEDYVTRGGFYNMRFKAARNQLIEGYLIRSGQEQVLKRGRRARSASNREQGGTVEHDEFEIPHSELRRIEVQAHRAALKDTREWMYTIERRTNLGKYGEWIYPFISATQNSATVVGKLLWKEPWLAPLIADIWRMPTRLGIEDEEGNVKIPIPFEAVRKALEDNPDIPFLGGVVDSADVLRIPKDGLNVWMPETGFGVAPRPTPWVQVGASELMKANLLPVETPQILRDTFGVKQGDEFWNVFKDYMFGEEQGLSSTFLSVDKLTPAYFQKLLQSKNELSAQYGYQYAAHYNTQMMRFQSGERDDRPTEEELAKRTTNSLLFGLLGNQGIPTPLTPYPILTRPMVDTPGALLQEVNLMLQKADPLNATMNMDKMFGDWAIPAANTKVTQNVGGANPTPETVSDIQDLGPLIRQITPDLGPNDLSVLGILINNRRSPESFEQSSYNWQKAGTIPGTNRQWREIQSPEEAVAERQRLAGWTMWTKFKHQLEAQMQSAGLTSYETKAAAPYKAAKDRFLESMFSNPDFAGWIVDFQDRGGSKTLSAVRVLEAAVQNEAFQNLLIKNGKERLFGIMNEYVTSRRLLLTVLEQSGHSIEHDSNIMWKIGWDAMRLKWRNQDERWAEIDSLYLSGDDNPQSPGNLGLIDIAEQQMGVAP